MEVNFVKLNPTQNMTILVESPVPRARHRSAALALMDYGGVYAEQVGFIEPPRDPAAWGRVQMMGGEFCGNATMSLAALLALDRKLPPSPFEIPVECSGADAPVKVRVRPGRRAVRCSLELPPPRRVSQITLHSGGRKCQVTRVDLEGVSHFVLPEESIRGDKKSWAEKAVRDWAGECDNEAVGLILHNRAESSIKPLVLVKPTGSLVWERGCGSGSAAVGAMLAHESGQKIRARLIQAGGVIEVRADFREGTAAGISITGQVRLVARGVAFLD